MSARQRRAHQTPSDLAALLVLSAVSLAATKRVRFQVHKSWKEPPNLYIVVAMPLSSGKSPVFSMVKEPLDACEVESQKEEAPALRRHSARRNRHLNRTKELERPIAKVDDPAKVDDLEARLNHDEDKLAALRSNRSAWPIWTGATPSDPTKIYVVS